MELPGHQPHAVRIQAAADAPAVVLSPHLDDAVLGCWSVLSGPGDVLVVNVFDGVPPSGSVTLWELITGCADSAAAMQERRREDAAALALAGRRSVGLGLPDQQHRHDPLPAERLGAALAAAVPAVSAIYAPAAIGGHADHVMVAALALELRAAGIPVRLWADVPYAVEYGWPSWVTGGERHPRIDPDPMWERFLHDLPCERAALVPEPRRLGDAEAAAKLEAMRAYGSQFPALDLAPIGRLSHPYVHGYEVLWTVAPLEPPPAPPRRRGLARAESRLRRRGRRRGR
jgi:LmbE family N-acetylglucosaminyl deacetylase